MIVVYTTDRAMGAWANGTRAKKTGTLPVDGHQDGALCTVIGSARTPVGLVYFVIWDDMPGMPVGVSEQRLKLVI